MKLREHAYNTILIFAGLIVLELVSYFFYNLVFDEWFSYSSIQKVKREIVFAEEAKVEDLLQGKKEVVHPYLGFVYNPDAWKNKHNGVPISEFGFIDNKDPIQKRSENKLIVGIFGGSVAWWFQNLQGQALIDGLKSIPKFKNKEIVLVPVALGGYKQPQQLMVLSYLLSLGAEFDLILNIDGYNEVALVNYETTVFPFYPRSWELRMMDVPSRDIQVSIGRIEYSKEQRKKIAKFFYGEPYRLSITINTIWRLYDRYLTNKLNLERLDLDNKRDKRNKDYYRLFEVTGPPYNFKKRAKLYKDIAFVWKNSSLAMMQLAEANGIEYFHFLQPNQYLPGSKVFNEEEKLKVYDTKFPQKEAVELGYPYLRQISSELNAKGEQYFDFSMIFSDVKETAYADNCCHLSKRGNEIMREKILEILTRHFQKG